MSSVTTTIKTEHCNFTDYRVYPGRGKKFVARDGKVYFFINGKSAAFHKRKVKPAKLKWNLAWRKANKKFQTELFNRKRSKKTSRPQKAIVGLSLDDLKSKRSQATKPAPKLNVKQSLLMDTKDKNRRSFDNSKSHQPTTSKSNVPKKLQRATVRN
ncbi:Ribosomal protein L24e family protein [Theileria parva strain Muguga]|nr:Ribosomal protein L24e family protein [Theileria parva strain Muguga]XP_954767.1 60S ribosomal L24 protein, putative [Theileria annulata]EAN30786.2 Ribosomal protein L24e family protein [Theileria parva strain Muguga]CAI75291.1 60S ribosomal L24 protein, putative [Theileria annulata]|eukprot:XP_954767.1 60S ribosomal L24 protein, putative [Theileria annulata]